VAWQVRRADGRIDGVPIQWENCTKELYDATLATGRYAGFERGPKCEVRALYDAPTPAVDTRVKPVAWTLADELARRESTCKAHLWFSDPVNTAWIPLYTDPTAALENGDGRDALESALRQIADQEHIELMLDPTWAQRIAIAALSRKTGEKDD
jgi:hypothetical protein